VEGYGKHEVATVPVASERCFEMSAKAGETLLATLLAKARQDIWSKSAEADF